MKQIKTLLASALALSLVAGTTLTAEASTFSDVSSNDWFYSYVTDMTDKGFVAGTSATTYSPTESLTIAQFSVMVTNGFYGRSLMQELEQDYDVWWEPYLRASSARSGLLGTVVEEESSWETTVHTEISRYDMAQIIFNLLGDNRAPLLSDTDRHEIISGFSDSIADEYQEAVAMAYYYGLISGRDDGSFDGTASLSRSEGAVVLSGLVYSDFVSIEQTVPDSSDHNWTAQPNNPELPDAPDGEGRPFPEFEGQPIPDMEGLEGLEEQPFPEGEEPFRDDLPMVFPEMEGQPMPEGQFSPSIHHSYSGIT